MTILIAGLLLFLAAHGFTTMRARRQTVVDAIGLGGYRAIFSVVALTAVALIVYGFGAYRASGYIPVWEPPRWAAHLAAPLMWIAFVCGTAAYSPLGKIKVTLRHPMLVAIKTWALAHLIANGDLGSIILFGAFLAFAVYDRIAMKRRGAGPIQTASQVCLRRCNRNRHRNNSVPAYVPISPDRNRRSHSRLTKQTGAKPSSVSFAPPASALASSSASKILTRARNHTHRRSCPAAPVVCRTTALETVRPDQVAIAVSSFCAGETR